MESNKKKNEIDNYAIIHHQIFDSTSSILIVRQYFSIEQKPRFARIVINQIIEIHFRRSVAIEQIPKCNCSIGEKCKKHMRLQFAPIDPKIGLHLVDSRIRKIIKIIRQSELFISLNISFALTIKETPERFCRFFRIQMHNAITTTREKER